MSPLLYQLSYAAKYSCERVIGLSLGYRLRDPSPRDPERERGVSPLLYQAKSAFQYLARTALRAPRFQRQGATTTAYQLRYAEEEQRWRWTVPPQPEGLG